MADTILILGYSARAMAESAYHAGYQVIALDYFGDYDTTQYGLSLSLSHTCRLPYSEEALGRLAVKLPRARLVYTGGLENHPALIDRLARHHVLVGNPSAVIKRARDWRWLSAFADRNRIRFPETLSSEEIPPRSGRECESWLVKPIASGGGLQINAWRGGALSPHQVLQRYVRGVPFSIQVLSTGDAAMVLGCSRLLVGNQRFGAKGYQYAGNIFPFWPQAETPRTPNPAATVSDLAHNLVRECQLRGLFGIDCILANDGIYLIEVNPRPTAAIDLLDLAYGCAFIRHHVQACESASLPQLAAPVCSEYLGKSIIYARTATTVPASIQWLRATHKDIPWPGERIGPGSPICSGYARASGPQRVVSLLEQDATYVYQRLTAGDA